MATFADLGLSEKMLSVVKRMGYSEPTPVQEAAIPLVLKHRDVIAAAQTGTGKTAGFALPAMDKLGHAKGKGGPLMLVVTPTRELAQQIGDVCGQVAETTHHRIVTVVGGLSYKPQIDKLSRGTDVLIATPGRLIDLMDQNAVRLGDVQVLVLDEADRMLDMGFLPAVKRIVAATPKGRQTLLFSATIDSSIRDITGKMLRDPATVEIAHKGDVADTVDQYIIRIAQAAKPALLEAVLQEKGFEKVIVFARTRSRAESCMRRLKRAGFYAESIHSDRSQAQRRRALDRFSKGEVNIICATDVLARGIDVELVDYVINYDIPEQTEDYIHRIGRTGRAGERGFSITFVTPETESNLRDIEKMIKQRIPQMELEHFDPQAASEEAVQKGQGVQARLDPDIVEAKRELAKRARKKGKRREQAALLGSASKSKAKPASGKRGKPGQPSKQTTSKQQPSSKKRGGAPARGASKQSAKSGDFRPGRAHRAEVRQQRSRKRTR